jgi:hypothetical protein
MRVGMIPNDVAFRIYSLEQPNCLPWGTGEADCSVHAMFREQSAHH